MAQLHLTWDTRAPQASFIPDSEWEQRKELICRLRPTMTLDALIEHMNVNHHFTASRHQYKLRFDKWQLPKLKTISRKPQGSTRAITNVSKRLPDGHSFTASSETTAGQAEPGLGKPSRAELSGNSSAGQDIPTCGNRVESAALTKETSADSPAMQPIAGQPDGDVMSITSISSETEPHVASVSCEGLLSERLRAVDGLLVEKLNIIDAGLNLEEAGPAPTQSALIPVVDTQTPVPLLPADRSSSASLPNDIYTRLLYKLLNALSEPSANVLNAIRKADVLLVVGSYQQAYNLYSRCWERVLAVYSEPVDNPFIVSVASNMSRAASSPAEIARVVAMMKRFIGPGFGRVKLDHIAECTLLIQLAILLRRVHGFDEAYSYYHHALSIWELWSSVHQEGWEVPANLIGQYIEANSISFLAQPGENLSLDLQRDLMKANFQYEGRLRKLFLRCALRLASHDNRKLMEGMNAARRSEWDSETIRRVLSTLLFCELWETFTCGVDQGRTPLIDEVEDLHKMCKGMRIGSPDLFAAISFLLVDVASPRYTGLQENFVGISMSTRSVEAESISVPLSNIPKFPHHFVSEKLSQAEFMQLFFNAHARNNLTRVSRVSALEAISEFIERLPMMDVHPQNIDNPDPERLAQPTTPINPILSLAPRSSFSSGFRSMKSLSKRIGGRNSGSIMTNGNHTETLSIRSSESWSLRYQLRLNGTSIKTFSSIDAKSSRNSVMDWEPGIEEGVVV